MINLYFDRKEKIYYYNVTDKACDRCSNIIVGIVTIRVVWDRLFSGVSYFCHNCKDGLKKSDGADYTETYPAIVTGKVPVKAVPIPFIKPSLSCARNMSTMDVAVNNLDGEHVTDKTVYAGRTEPKVKEYLIESESEDIDIALEHRPLNDKELDNFFSSMKSAQVYIDVDDKVKVLK